MRPTWNVEERSREDARVVVSLEVPADSIFFEGHFEGRPMLPGVAQVVALAEEEARRAWTLGASRKLGRVKFQATITPGARVRLTLEGAEPTDDERVVRFRIETVGEAPELAAQGTMTFALA